MVQTRASRGMKKVMKSAPKKVVDQGEGKASIFSNPICFSTVYGHLDSNDKATLRFVNKELRDAVNLNARGLKAESLDAPHLILNLPNLILNLPNLESISGKLSFSSGGIVNVFQGAKLASKLTKLELENSDGGGFLSEGERERREGLLGDSFGTISHSQWPLLKKLSIKELDMPLTLQSMKGLMRLSTLTQLDLYCSSGMLAQFPYHGRTAIDQGFAQIQPGSWPHLQKLQMCYNILSDNPVGAVKGLLHLTSLQELNMSICRLTGEAISQIKPGDWRCLQRLDLGGNHFSTNPVEAMKGLLHLTALTELDLHNCDLSGEAISQIKFIDWRCLEKLELSYNYFIDNPVGAMKGLLHLTALTELKLDSCGLTGEAVSQIKAGDWPHLQKLQMCYNNLKDDPVGAVKGLLHLTSLQELNMGTCRLTGQAVSQIKPGDWPHLQKLEIMGYSSCQKI